MKKKSSKKSLNFLLIMYATVSLALLAVGVGSWWAYSYSTDMVKQELSAQKIYFPEKGSDGLKPEEFPDLQKYAGQQVDDGQKARAYANGFIGRHLEKVAGGKTYAEVSTEAMKNPDDKKLAGQKQTLFMGETLRGLLLNAYAFWTIGKLLQAVSIVAFISSALLIALTVRLRNIA